MTARATGALLATGLLLLGACSDDAPFSERDPRGYEACSEWAGYASKGDTVSVIGGSVEVAEIARKSSTEEIRESASNLFDDETLEAAGGEQFGLLDAKRLEKACEDEGFEFD